MTLDELLSELRSNVLRDSSGLISGPTDLLWTDDTLVRYLNDAQRRFTRRTLCLRDASTPACCNVTLVAGQTDYTLHPSVLAVISAKNEDETFYLPRIGQQGILGSMQPETEPYGSYSTAQEAPGKPRAWMTDEQLDLDASNRKQVVRFTVYPEPAIEYDGDIINIRVARLPLIPLDVNQPANEPEIPEDYHLDLLEWVAYRAKRNWDVDGQDKTMAESHKARFAECVTEAIQETKRKVFVPAQWQFGMNGFTHQR